MTWPIRDEDLRRAAAVVGRWLPPTPLRRYPGLDQVAGAGLTVFVKHENHQPTNSFKVRSNLFALHALAPEAKMRGVVAASRGNHGLGLAWAGRQLDVPVTICVPRGNNPEKNADIRGLGATLIEEGKDYDESVHIAVERMREQRLHMIHSTNDPTILAGAATLGWEMVQQESLDAIVVAVGGGSQAVGAITAARTLAPEIPVYAVQAANAPAIHDSWHARRPLQRDSAETFADGLATRQTYPGTFDALVSGLAGFVTVTESEIAEAVRILLRATHNLAEGAGAAGLAGLLRLRQELAGRRVGVILSGGNIDTDTLRNVLCGKL